MFFLQFGSVRTTITDQADRRFMKKKKRSIRLKLCILILIKLRYNLISLATALSLQESKL